MSGNPLDDSDEAYQHRIRERAYHLWEADGGPHGRHDEYWERARELIGMEESAGSGQLPNPMTVPGADPSRTTPIEEASIQENLGEFPDRLSDQGEHPSTPNAKLATTPPAEPLTGPTNAGSKPSKAAPVAKPVGAKAAAPATEAPPAKTKAESGKGKTKKKS